MVLSLIVAIVSIVGFALDAFDESTKCTFSALLTAVVTYWFVPRAASGRVFSVGEDDRAPPFSP